MFKNLYAYTKPDEFVLKLSRPLFYLKYILLSCVIIAAAIVVNIIAVKNKFLSYYEVNNGFIQQLSQFNNNEKIYEKLLELSSSIYELETIKKSNFFSAEIWNCDVCESNDFPVWQINDTFFTEFRDRILNRINHKDDFFLINKSLYYATIIPIFSKNVENNKINQNVIYKMVYYSKIPVFTFFGFEPNFFVSFAIFVLMATACLIFGLGFPLHIISLFSERNIEKRAIFNIKNLIEHTLVNQENILKYGNNTDEKIKKSLHHNNEAQILLKNIQYEEIDVEELLLSLRNDIYFTNDLNIVCNLKLENKILFCKNLIVLAFGTIINNAIHPSVMAKNITINIFQKTFRHRIVVEISNDGAEIPDKNRKRIFHGLTTKEDGHGLGLKNLKKLLKEAGSSLSLLKTQQTSFSFDVKQSDTKHRINKSFKLNKVVPKSDVRQKPVLNENLPLVVIIEDEELIWDAWALNMPDAHKIFFKTPDDFFLHSDVEKYNGRPFIEKIKMIICDYDFGNNTNLSNSGFFNTLDREDEIFKGHFVLCTGFNESITQDIPDKILNKIDLFFQKRPCSYSAMRKLIGLS